MYYTDKFKRKMVQKLTGPNALSALALSKQVDVSQTSLSRWLRKAGIETCSSIQTNTPNTLHMRPPVTPKSPNAWTPEEKLKTVLEAATLSDEELDAFLRRKGLHETHLTQWRLQMLNGLGKQHPFPKTKRNTSDSRQIKVLEKELLRKDKALAETAVLLVLKKKSRKSGGTGTTTRPPRTGIDLGLMAEAEKSGARLEAAADILDLSTRTIMRWRKGPSLPPSNKLSEAERNKIVDVANSAPYRDLSPKQIVPKLADQGTYIGSESTFYRVLKEQSMLKHRQSSKPATHKKPNEHAAKGPCQVWSWDITYLHSPVRGMFFYLYMIVDVWSRKIIAATVFDVESMELSAMLIANACSTHNVQPDSLVLHSDNGGPMKVSTMLATLQNLGVVPSFSRPMVSDDNPYSESLFRTMKYRPCYPSKPFENLADAQA